MLGRRDVLAGASVLLSRPAAAGPADNRFQHGVASGDPAQSSLLLWTRVTTDERAPVAVSWEVAADPRFSRPVANGVAMAEPARDFTVQTRVTGLKPDRHYWYRFRSGAQLSPAGRSRTLPARGMRPFRLAVVSCANYPSGWFHVYRAIAERSDVDCVLHLGDYIYEYGPAGAATADSRALGRVPRPPRDAVSLADYRTRHAQYRSDPDLQAMHAAHPVIAIWDDHDVANDAWSDGAENHRPSQGSYGDRQAAGLRAYREWLPIGSAAARRIYRAFEIGDLASLILIDTRQDGRPRPVPRGEWLRDQAAAATTLADPSRSLLSAEQTRWFAAALARGAGKPWTVIGHASPIMGLNMPPVADLLEMTTSRYVPAAALQDVVGLGQRQGPFNLDGWDGYPLARDRLLDAVAAAGGRPIFLSGDVHMALAGSVLRGGRVCAAEFTTTAVTSPGFAQYLPADPAKVTQRFLAANPHISHVDGHDRGWLELELTEAGATASFHSVSSVLQPAFTVAAGPRFRVAADALSPRRL